MRGAGKVAHRAWRCLGCWYALGLGGIGSGAVLVKDALRHDLHPSTVLMAAAGVYVIHRLAHDNYRP